MYWMGACFSKKKKKKKRFSQFSARFSIFPDLNVLCPPTNGGWGGGVGGGEHIGFSADPVGVGIATCLYSISLLNGQILAKLIQIYHWEGENAD